MLGSVPCPPSPAASRDPSPIYKAYSDIHYITAAHPMRICPAHPLVTHPLGHHRVHTRAVGARGTSAGSDPGSGAPVNISKRAQEGVNRRCAHFGRGQKGSRARGMRHGYQDDRVRRKEHVGAEGDAADVGPSAGSHLQHRALLRIS